MKLVRYFLIVLTAAAMMSAQQAKQAAPAKGTDTKAAPTVVGAKTPLLDINSASAQDFEGATWNRRRILGEDYRGAALQGEEPARPEENRSPRNLREDQGHDHR